MNEIKKSLLSVVLVVLLAVLGYFLYQNYDQAQNEKARQAAAGRAGAQGERESCNQSQASSALQIDQSHSNAPHFQSAIFGPAILRPHPAEGVLRAKRNFELASATGDA